MNNKHKWEKFESIYPTLGITSYRCKLCKTRKEIANLKYKYFDEFYSAYASNVVYFVEVSYGEDLILETATIKKPNCNEIIMKQILK